MSYDYTYLQVSYGLHELLRNNAANIHTKEDWNVIFTLLEVVGAGASPDIGSHHHTHCIYNSLHSVSFPKCCEGLSFLVRDVVHINHENFSSCVTAIRTFVETSYRYVVWYLVSCV